MSPTNLAASLDRAQEHTMTSSDAAKKLEKINLEIEKVKAEKIALNPHKERKRLAPPINHAEKPKKSFSHPKLDFIYGEVMASPYLTKPLDPYPKEVFSTVETLRELKRQGVKAIADLPRDRQPYNPKRTRNLFIREVVNYEVSFLPKGYEEKKAKEIRAQQREAEWELLQQQQLQELLGKDEKMPKIESLRPVSASAPKSHTLLGNICRGGPEKYKKELGELRQKRMSMTQEQRVKEMHDACAAVEDEARRQRLAAEHARDLARRLKASAKDREVAVDDDIHRFKDTAYRVKRSQVTRMDRVCSPPQLLRRRFQDMDEEDYGKRGRSKSPPRLRSQSPETTSRRPPGHGQGHTMSQSQSKAMIVSRSLDASSGAKGLRNMGGKAGKAKAADSASSAVSLAQEQQQHRDSLGGPAASDAASGQAFAITAMSASYDEYDDDMHALADVANTGSSIAYEQPNFSAFGAGEEGEYGSIDDVAEEIERPTTGGRGATVATAAAASSASSVSSANASGADGLGVGVGAGSGRRSKASSNFTAAVAEDFPEYTGDFEDSSSAPASRGGGAALPLPAAEEKEYGFDFDEAAGGSAEKPSANNNNDDQEAEAEAAEEAAVVEAYGEDVDFATLSIDGGAAEEKGSSKGDSRRSNNDKDDGAASASASENGNDGHKSGESAAAGGDSSRVDTKGESLDDAAGNVPAPVPVPVPDEEDDNDNDKYKQHRGSVDAAESFASVPASFNPTADASLNTNSAPLVSAEV